jgi:hypothetical protein
MRRHSPLNGRPARHHLEDAQGPPPERDDPQRVVLADDGRQVDPGLAEPSQDLPVVLEQLRLLRLWGPWLQLLSASAIETPVYSSSTCSGSF